MNLPFTNELSPAYYFHHIRSREAIIDLFQVRSQCEFGFEIIRLIFLYGSVDVFAVRV